ncbi:MAG: TetR/AcrR family transcriptional regulator [Ignavibacteria bacterium]|nr:TetR/AcrR family transcriptional regulator [Ignavibacteria bacterium]
MRTKEGNKEQEILEAALRVFAEYGYPNAKVGKIAEIAGVSTGSIYVYYKNKEAIFIEIIERLWAQLVGQLRMIEQRTDITAIEKFDGLIDVLFDAFVDKPFLARAILNEFQEDINITKATYLEDYHEFLSIGKKVFLDGVAEGNFNPNFNVEVIKLFVLGGVRMLLHQWANDPQDLTINLLRQNVKYFCRRGILAQGR